MLFTDPKPFLARLKRELPPTMPIPSILQTLACRRLFFSYVERCRSRYGNSFTVYPMDMPPLVFLCDPDDVQQMIAAPPTALHPGAGGTLLAPLIGRAPSCCARKRSISMDAARSCRSFIVKW